MDPLYSGEKLRQKWGEYLPAPARVRVNIIDFAIQHVRSCQPVQESNIERSQRAAAERIDSYMIPEEDPAQDSGRARQANDHIDFNYVNEGPVRDAKLVEKAVASSMNAEKMANAYEALARIHGEQQSAQ